jgi:class 3 adenylate cyclase
VSIVEVRFVRNGEVNLAYTVLGEGGVDLVYVPLWWSNLDVLLGYPAVASFFERMASYSRLLIYDRRGSGLSDRLTGTASLEESVDDLLAVIEAAELKRPALLAFNEGATVAALAAASHPGAIGSLILYGAYASTTRRDDYPWGTPPDERAQEVAWVTALWPSRELAEMMVPGTEPGLVDFIQRLLRNSISKDALARAYDLLGETDVRHVLPTIRVPTLVLHRRDDQTVVIDNGRYIAERVPEARFVELAGHLHPPFLGEADAFHEEVEEFLTGHRSPRVDDRVLATIMFTDIVASTELAARLGDRDWRALLDRHDALVRNLLAQYSGRLVKSTGDGVLATFDGPARAIRCASALVRALGDIGVEVRAGLHTGEVELRGGDLGGIAVHIGARVCELAEPGKVYVSGSVPPLVAGSGIAFEDLGPASLKGVEGSWSLHRVVAG